MKNLLLCLLLIAFAMQAKADHITGGEIFYTYQGNDVYNVTLKLYMRCNSGRQFNNPTIVSIFNKNTNTRISNVSVPLTRREQISISNPDPCITNPPIVCYDVGYYEFALTLPSSSDGYILSSQVNYRINGINNLGSYSQVGATYTAEVPGTSGIASGPQNNSAKFIGSDLVVVCANNRMSYSFAAEDADNDELIYSLCGAYTSGTTGAGAQIPPPPPYNTVPYGNGFSSFSPLGNLVQINSSTGLISGIAPNEGVYVVTVCVQEKRNGIVIATQRKDLQLHIAACGIAGAILEPSYQLCGETNSITLSNLSISPLILSQAWEIVDRQGNIIFTSAAATPNYTFADTGLYTIKLAINRGQPCTDSTAAPIRVYPGFRPGFVFAGICFTKPTRFTDTTTSIYGMANSWQWDMNDGGSAGSQPTAQNPAYTFTSMGTHNVRLITGNTVGCLDTVMIPVQIVDKPPVNLLFKDTLICLGDTVTLRAGSSGSFVWSPNTNMLNNNSPNPSVYPFVTTKYYADVDEDGCKNRDSVQVRVTNSVDLQMMPDTTICTSDTIQLRIVSNAFVYRWSPAAQLIDATQKIPLAITNNLTTYGVTARIGGNCVATGSINVKTIPYPIADAGRDTTLCFNTSLQLNGKANGSSSAWSPAALVSNAAILNPVIKPLQTTSFILSAFDNLGCPKPGKDTVLIKVLADIKAFAGNDTAVVAGQPLQLNGSGGVRYQWLPGTSLSATNIANPIAIFDGPSPGERYKLRVFNEANCVDSAYINIKVFASGPTVYVPSGFTPNADGRNDVLRPIAVGMKSIDNFSIYNRWGQQVFTTKEFNKGWNGFMNGLPQGSGSYVWMVKATDYTGKNYFQKGTVTLVK